AEGGGEVGGAGERGGRRVGRLARRGMDTEVTEERVVQGPLDGDHLGGVAAEHLDPGGVRRAARHGRERLRVAPQVNRVLQHVEREGVLLQAAVGQPGEERVREDGTVDIGGPLPQLIGEAVTHRAAPSAWTTWPPVSRLARSRATCGTHRRGVGMLESSDVIAFVSATNLNRARAFYEQTLGLPVVGHTDFACVFDANGTMLRVTVVSEVSRAGYTVLGWQVTDIAAAVRGLKARGVVFIRYDGM